MIRAVQKLCVYVCPGIGGDLPYLKVSIWLIRSSGWRASNSVPGEYWIIYSLPASPLTPYPGPNSTTQRWGGSVRGRPSDPCQTKTLARISVLPSRSFCTVYFCQVVELWYSVVDHITCKFVRGGDVKCWRGEALRAELHVFPYNFKNVHLDWNYKFAPNIVNVFETGVTLPGRCEMSLAAATSCRLQLS
jgi:hypothetical protein